MSTKRFQAWYFVVSTKLGILGQLRILGQAGESFPFYSGPMLSCPEAKGCRQKDSKLGVLWYRQRYLGVSTKLGILGQLGILG
jgi:hypothetical protein